MLRPKSCVLFGEKTVLDLPIDDSLALPATGFRQYERAVQRQRNYVLVVEPLHGRRNVADSTVNALTDRRVPHVQSLLVLEELSRHTNGWRTRQFQSPGRRAGGKPL